MIVVKVLSIFAMVIAFTSCNQNDSGDNSVNLSPNTLRIGAIEDPQTIDPRLVRALPDITVIHMLYEGLMRKGVDGQLLPALAEGVEVSGDKLTYTFTLRHAKWSNGDPVTAGDFAETWLSTLDSNFPSPNAYQLYPIQNARKAKSGTVLLEQVGVKVADPQTLIVTLEQPTPYFLELLTSHFYFPVHHSIRNQENSPIITNGPFSLESWKHGHHFRVVKNTHYWDHEAVHLDVVELVPVEETTALQMFETGGLDWVGSPLSAIPQDAVQILRDQGRLDLSSGAGTHWFRFNTEVNPFGNKKIRKAFAAALDRKSIVEHVTQGNQIPATGIIPPSMGLGGKGYFVDNDLSGAELLFQEALGEMQLTKKHFPEVSLVYAMNERNHKLAQAVQQQWEKAFDIAVRLENREVGVYYHLLATGDFQIALGSWYADINDPINILDLFKYRENTTNNTGWEDSNFQRLLNLSSEQSDQESRRELLGMAEALMMEEMPVAPLFFSTYNYLKKNHVHGVYFSELGFLDFKHAFIREQE